MPNTDNQEGSTARSRRSRCRLAIGGLPAAASAAINPQTVVTADLAELHMILRLAQKGLAK